MKFIAVTLTALFLSTSAMPAQAERQDESNRTAASSVSDSARLNNPNLVFTLQSNIPGLNGCCVA